MFTVDVLTLFPESVMATLGESIIKRAAKKGLVDVKAHQIRDFTKNKQNQVDDYPYGGGRGCVMQAQPLADCLNYAASQRSGRLRKIYLSPCGKPFTEADAKRLSSEYDGLILVCGHYEGVDQRFIDACIDEEISLGDFVLTGGEIAAMAVADAVLRLIPGVLSDAECYEDESHWDGLLEYPQYSRPEEWNGLKVPEVLLRGDHSEVSRWRRKQQLIRTSKRRPDMFSALELSEDDKKLLDEARRDEKRESLSDSILCRQMDESDIPAVLGIADGARAFLRKNGVDQWQDGYPSESVIRADIERGEAFVLTVGGSVAAFFALCKEPEAGYAAITDGKWSDDLPYCSLHRVAVAPEYRGCGLADRIVSEAEAMTRALGRKRLRGDTHKKNKPMQKLLSRSGFRYRGNVLVPVSQGHDPRRMAYEKRIKD